MQQLKVILTTQDPSPALFAMGVQFALTNYFAALTGLRVLDTHRAISTANLLKAKRRWL